MVVYMEIVTGDSTALFITEFVDLSFNWIIYDFLKREIELFFRYSFSSIHRCLLCLCLLLLLDTECPNRSLSLCRGLVFSYSREDCGTYCGPSQPVLGEWHRGGRLLWSWRKYHSVCPNREER